MLELKNIVKVYGEGTALPVKALRGVSVGFSSAEFCSILGQSGCGKTTLLNIIGGLDRYTEGDLLIDGVSTKQYTDRDWDAYRNHSVGFIFQSYNLIPHQTVIKNVELALTLSGVDKETRRERAKKALERVGLTDQINKLPNQLSGGQMQRVAIARAIVNDPEIILADEPTGALDSETSVQIMEILKELSADRLVIMVTHNAELAHKYSTRIVTLSDGLIIGDEPNTPEDKTAPAAQTEKQKEKVKNGKKPSMSLLTAFSLSLNNLFTKKGRTFLTAFAGSIGIIGIALILSLSAGFNTYIDNIQRDTLSSYPITIAQRSFDTTSVFATFMGNAERKGEEFPTGDKVTSQDTIENMLTSFIGSIDTNDLKTFKTFLDEHSSDPAISAIQYSYGLDLGLYRKIGDEYRQLNPVVLPDPEDIFVKNDMFEMYYNNFKTIMNNQGIMSEMINNPELLNSQYDVLKGNWPQKADEAVLVVDSYNQISDLELYMLGIMNDADLAYVFQRLMLDMMPSTKNLSDEEKEQRVRENLAEKGYTQLGRSDKEYTFEQLMQLEYNVTLPYENYVKSGTVKTVYKEDGTETEFPLWREMTEEETAEYLAANDKSVLEGGTKIKISGIVRLKEGVAAGSLSSKLCYSKKLTDLLVKKVNESEIAVQHLRQDGWMDDNKWSVLEKYASPWQDVSGEVYEGITSLLGIVDGETPTSIAIYPVSFEAKDKVVAMIEEYNETHGESQQIKYTDNIGLLLSSITTIINAVTYVLIAFVSISLIVSSIMISVITHISVLERTKEIGVLRSIGASKRDVSRVFNAETAIIGFVAGVLGIIITMLLNIPISLVIESLAGLKNISALPVWGGVSLIIISTLLTVIAGLIPARKASKQDPVVALRSE